MLGPCCWQAYCICSITPAMGIGLNLGGVAGMSSISACTRIMDCVREREIYIYMLKRDPSSVSFRPSIHRVCKILLSNWSLLQVRTEVAQILDQPPLLAYKRDTNILDMLVRSKLRQPATRPPGTTPCNTPKCRTCPFICTATKIQGPKSQMNITKQFNCLTYYILYVIH